METEIQGYAADFNIAREQVRNAIRGLGDDAASWQPLPEGTNSIYAILTHLVGSEAKWIHHHVGGRPLQRDRDAEFLASGRFADVVERWEAGGKETDAILAKLTPSQLGEPRIVEMATRSETRNVNVRWCVLHMLNHMAIHVGHIQLTRQLWEHQHGQK